MGIFDRMKKIGIFSGSSQLDDEFYDDLEESLILADTGAGTAAQAVEQLREKVSEEKIKTPEEARECMCGILCEKLQGASPELDLSTHPSVVMMVGVNGVGKTTTIGKLAARMKKDGKKVILAAGDTFRAAAADQLAVWAERTGAGLVRQNEGADPASVVFDALSAAKARDADVVLVDTAGRLHNKQNLMNELSKISRVIDRELPDAARENLLVLDATTGQNGLVQAREFQKSTDLTGIVLTKLDGSAKGGIVLAIAEEMGLPVKYVGLGEGADDLQPFDAKAWAEALI
ncbi:MAG: signal recognition particle-docking protein FtsY [Oscillospiraceae bacterium]|nr:signal recognition particle-docking protein FtsY [Oscillospiraceae bacterium]